MQVSNISVTVIINPISAILLGYSNEGKTAGLWYINVPSFYFLGNILP